MIGVRKVQGGKKNSLREQHKANQRKLEMYTHLNPNEEFTLELLAESYMQNQEYESAIKELDRMLTMQRDDPLRARRWYVFGQRLRTGKKKEISGFFEVSGNHKNKIAEWYNNRLVMIRMLYATRVGKYKWRNEASETIFENLIEGFESLFEHYGNATLLNNFGAIKMEELELGRAVRALEAALKIQPDNYAVHYNLAIAYKMQHDKEEEQKHIDVLLRLQPKLRANQSALFPEYVRTFSSKHLGF